LTRRELLFGKKPLETAMTCEDGATVAEYAILACVLGIVGLSTYSKLKRRKTKPA